MAEGHLPGVRECFLNHDDVLNYIHFSEMLHYSNNSQAANARSAWDNNYEKEDWGVVSALSVVHPQLQEPHGDASIVSMQVGLLHACLQGPKASFDTAEEPWASLFSHSELKSTTCEEFWGLQQEIPLKTGISEDVETPYCRDMAEGHLPGVRECFLNHDDVLNYIHFSEMLHYSNNSQAANARSAWDNNYEKEDWGVVAALSVVHPQLQEPHGDASIVSMQVGLLHACLQGPKASFDTAEEPWASLFSHSELKS